MDSREFRKKLLESKKKRVIEIVNSVCERENLPIPKVNFEGCPQEDQDQLAHYHPDQNKICISEIQLYKLKTLRDVENTIYHELAHILEQNHGGEFEQTKNKFKLKDWRPPRGVIYIKGDRKREPLKPDKETIDKTRCNYHLCRKKRKLYKCPYCERYFCKEHRKPVVPGKSILEERGMDFGKIDYHPCPGYVEVAKKQKEDEIEKYGKALDILKHENINLEFKTEKKDEEKLKEAKFEEDYQKFKEQITRNNKKTESKEHNKPIMKMSKEEIEESRKKLGINTNIGIATKKSTAGDQCEFCGSKNTIPIIYGLVHFEGKQALGISRDGKKYYGGCVINENSPSLYCKKCHRKFGNYASSEMIDTENKSKGRPKKKGFFEKVKDAFGIK